MRQEQSSKGSWWKRIAWLVAIWAASVATLAAVAWVLKVVMRAVGMSH